MTRRGGELLSVFRRRTKALGDIGPIGLELGAFNLSLRQLRRRDDARYDICADARVPVAESRATLLSDRKSFRRLLRNAMRGRRFRGRKVVAAMPADAVKVMPVTYRADRQNTTDAMLNVIAGRVEGGLDDYVIDCLPVRGAQEQDENLVLAAVARRDAVFAFLDLIEGAGLHVEALDIGPAAIRRLVSVVRPGEDNKQTVLVLNSGNARSYLSVVSGRRLLFDQAVDFGEQQLVGDIATALELDTGAAREMVLRHGFDDTTRCDHSDHGSTSHAAEILREIVKHRFVSLVDEINRILVFTAAETRGQPISRIVVLGSIAHWPGADSLLRELIDVPEEAGEVQLDDWFIYASRQAVDERLSVRDMAVATGLALRGVM